MHPRKIHLLRICNFLTQKNVLCWEKGWGAAVLLLWSIFPVYFVSKYCSEITGVAALCHCVLGDHWEVCELIYTYLVGWDIKGGIFCSIIYLFKGYIEKSSFEQPGLHSALWEFALVRKLYWWHHFAVTGQSLQLHLCIIFVLPELSLLNILFIGQFPQISATYLVLKPFG